MTKQTIIATAAALFAAGTISTSAFAEVKCAGTNACKGQGACKTSSSACKGQNACKGQGWTQSGNSLECGQRGGRVVY
jgi:hypothetical protein